MVTMATEVTSFLRDLIGRYVIDVIMVSMAMEVTSCLRDLIGQEGSHDVGDVIMASMTPEVMSSW